MEGYHHLTYEERVRIETLLGESRNAAQIALRLGCHRSTVRRELQRNGNADGSYRAASAHQRAGRRPRGRPPAKIRPPTLAEPQGNATWQFVREKLCDEHWSPQLIAGRLGLRQPQAAVCMETIYRFIYHPAQLPARWWRHLLRQRAARRKRSGRATLRAQSKRGPSIDLRCAAANTRSAFGHWEADLLCFARQLGVILHVVERRSRFRFALILPGKHAQPLALKLIAAFDALPAVLRDTLTMDNGSEFAAWRLLYDEFHIECYFCHPYAAWQKGTLEALNGVLRRYLPRDTDLRTLDQEELTDICEELNDRPMRVLGFRTPREVLHSELGISVALHL
jgi:IS30 family transposase